MPSMCADATGAVGEELTGPPKVLMGGGGGGMRCGRVRDQGSGSRQALYTRRPPGKRTLDPGSELREEEKPAEGGASQTLDSRKQGPWENKRWDKVDGKGTP